MQWIQITPPYTQVPAASAKSLDIELQTLRNRWLRKLLATETQNHCNGLFPRPLLQNHKLACLISIAICSLLAAISQSSHTGLPVWTFQVEITCPVSVLPSFSPRPGASRSRSEVSPKKVLSVQRVWSAHRERRGEGQEDSLSYKYRQERLIQDLVRRVD